VLDSQPGLSSFLQTHVGLNNEGDATKWWFSQQEYVLKHLGRALASFEPYERVLFITSIHFNCTLKTHLDGFTLRGTFMADSPSDEVYLFLFTPKVELVDGCFTFTNPPDTEKYYWAFNPTGVDRLTHQTAEDIGLPVVEFSIFLSKSDHHHSNLIPDFHAAKGFDPDSQEAAITMGYLLMDVEGIKKFARELTGESSMDRRDNDVENEIYYSLGLC